MGIKITTDGKPVKVWRSERNGFASYAISVSRKDGDHWITGYQDVRFLKGIGVKNGTEITIKEAFPTLSTWVKDGQQFKKIVWQILEFEGPCFKNEDVPQETAFSETDADEPF